VAAAAGALALVVFSATAVASPGGSSHLTLAGLKAPVEVVRDRVGVPHIHAASEYDAYFMVGYLHAQDRLFQMDASRHQAGGTLAELLGPSAIGSDAFLRTIGLRRAAARSLAALSPQTVAILDAYADSVNAWLARHPLPSEYAALELSKASVPAWTPLDTAAIGKLLAFGVSFDIGDIPGTQKLLAYRAAGAAQGSTGPGCSSTTSSTGRSRP
jgi:penicillin G amidase